VRPPHMTHPSFLLLERLLHLQAFSLKLTWLEDVVDATADLTNFYKVFMWRIFQTN
jgi:hypothetical protein